ncbi:trace amine-associated receptor 13c-like [Danio aesculapii]|uniref:trace amine-associated receptor 13c-like n=1 Tax=Danio aesculapii TaxID=1142201 RepID=UPI0024BF6938|nr:trace amine-associated receptor 13c-like [Danio aesculapii]
MAYETEETQYCYPAFNSSCVKGKRSNYESNILYVFFSLLSAWTVFLNLLVIISISHFKKLHTPTNMIILSLSVADLLVGLIVMPIEAIELIETCWYFGDALCNLFLILMGLLTSTSLCSLVFIAVDRYVAVCHPLMYPQTITMNRTLIIVCFSWFFSSAYNIILSITHTTDGCYGECNVQLTFEWKATDLVLSFLLPCTVIITLHLRIFYVVHQQVKVINSQMKSEKCVTEGSVKRKSESKAALILGIIVAIHLICFITYYILTLTDSIAIPPAVLSCLIWFLYINSSLDPLLYALFYTWFRKSIKHILTLKIFQPESSQVNILTNH